MTLVVDATPGDADANSYVTLEEAEDYFASRLHDDAWYAADDEVKEAAIVWATRVIDAQVYFTGQAATSEQALAWPRTGMLTRNGYAIPDDVIPADLKNATSELAMQLITADRTLRTDAAEQGLTSLKAGPVTLAFKDQIEQVVVQNSVLALMPITWYVPKTLPGAIVV